MAFHFYHTIDIKLASCLDSLGIPFRQSDPVTRVLQEKNGRPFEQCTYWFDTTDDATRKLCAIFEDAYETAKPLFEWKKKIRKGEIKPETPPPSGNYYKLDPESPLYYEMDALYLREVWLDWTRNGADLRKLIQEGSKTINISTRASQYTKDLIKKYI